jgi:two-component system OmpR family response regulator
MLRDAFQEHGFRVALASSGVAMDDYLRGQAADVIILDVMLPGEDGLALCRRLRAVSRVPILMLTALGSEIDRVLGLEIGADDYVTKPFSSRELIARVRALLRRAQSDTDRAQPPSLLKGYRFAGWRIEPSARQLYNPAGVRVSLTSAEFDLLFAFCENPGRVLSREQLLELMHSGAAGPLGRSVDVHVSRVRQKLESEAFEGELIKTVRLGGYIFTPRVELL